MGYKCIYDNLTQIKTDLMESINRVQKRARISLLDEADVEWAIEKMKKNKNGKITLLSGVPNTHIYRAVSTLVKIAFLHRRGKIAILSKISRHKLSRNPYQTNLRKFEELHFISSPFDYDILMLYKVFAGDEKEMRLRRYINFREVREKIRKDLKQWEFAFPFSYENFQIETVVISRRKPLVLIAGLEINSGKYVTYFILPKPYDSFRFNKWLVAPKGGTEIEEIFHEATGEKMPETPEEITAILTIAAI